MRIFTMLPSLTVPAQLYIYRHKKRPSALDDLSYKTIINRTRYSAGKAFAFSYLPSAR